MGKYIIRRIIALLPVLFGVSVVVFFLMHLAPGDVTSSLLGPGASKADAEALKKVMGLDRPLPVQYLKWLGLVFKGDFGRSIVNSVAVNKIVFTRFLNTGILAAFSLGLTLIIGFLVGMFAAARSHSLFDKISISCTVVLGTTPPYWFGLMLVLLFSLKFPIFPATGMYDLLGNGGLLDLLKHLILPGVATAVGPAAVIARMVRASMLEELSQPYVRVARSKGITRKVILWKHALINALPPISTISGLQLGGLLGGALFTEVVFVWPGLGSQLYQSILASDIPVVQATVLLIAFLFVLVNLLVDILNAFLDPRIRLA